MKPLLFKFLICSMITIAGVIPRLIFKGKKLGKPDNQIEEFMEEMLYRQTGINVDLSPGTPDKDFDHDVFLEELMEIINANEKEAL